MTLAYFDCFSGISGDMALGALVDAGVPIDGLRSELAKLNLAGYTIASETVQRAGLKATKVHVNLDRGEQPLRRLADIRKIIAASRLSTAIQKKSIGVFDRLAEAEATVHGTTPDKVHFHEVGAIDAVVDIVGTIIGFELLGITSIAASPVNLGSGTIRTSHGTLPVPAPATIELLKGIPSYGSSIPFELTTPTGAAILSTVASAFGPLPAMTPKQAACGAGGKDIPGHPNVLRLLIGEPSGLYAADQSIIIETNIDDMNPQIYDYVMEQLLNHGARDAYLSPVIMKKGRPGVLLSVLCDRAESDALIDIILRETTSIGLRIHEVGRLKLKREITETETRFGKVRIKISRRGETIVTATPEYEDCRKIAEEKKVALKAVLEEAQRQFFRKEEKGSEK